MQNLETSSRFLEVLQIAITWYFFFFEIEIDKEIMVLFIYIKKIKKGKKGTFYLLF